MKIYLVGGAVRDELLGLPVTERDWVVVGSTPEEMTAQGFRPVGKDFPVFLHPETHEEYALARTERKTAKGYKGFAFYAADDVTLEQDLQRRDLTINAIAQDNDGTLIDPYNGQDDLTGKCFRHVSPAFSEDPVRILRVARFAARLPDFSIHPDTLQLMKTMVTNGEVAALVAERVWQEFEKALCEPKPQRFFETLSACDALATLFPECTDTAAQCLSAASELSPAADVRFAAFTSTMTVDDAKILCQRIRVPQDYQSLALAAIKHGADYEAADTAAANDQLALLEAFDAFRRPERFFHFLDAFRILWPNTSPCAQALQNAYKKAAAVDAKPLTEKYQGKAIADALRQLRIDAIG